MSTTQRLGMSDNEITMMKALYERLPQANKDRIENDFKGYGCDDEPFMYMIHIMIHGPIHYLQ